MIRPAAVTLVLSLLTLTVGCSSVAKRRCVDLDAATFSDVPRELEKATIPVYRIEPPDILLIETVRDLKRASIPLRPGDELLIQATNTLPIDPEDDPTTNAAKVIGGVYAIEVDGTIDLGPEYGRVKVAGLTIRDSREAIVVHLQNEIGLTDPRVSVTNGTPGSLQPVAGEHLVQPDGTINLGLYGSVHVAGLSVDEVRTTIERHLGQFIADPLVRVNVLGFNSKVVYVIMDGGGFGEQVVRLPHTGNETVLDAISQVQGLSDVSSKTMWVARPAPAQTGIAQTLPVDWRGITQDGVTATNYQLFPGDRIYVKADNMISIDNALSKLLAPVERVFGVILLGNSTVRNLQGQGNGNGGGGFGF